MHYLEPHQGTWRVRVVVPPRLQDKLGKTALRYETGIALDDFDRAARVSAPIIKKYRAQIARADGRPVFGRFLRDTRAETRSCEWYTPEWVFATMPGVVFDLDVASPGQHVVPWVPAVEHITEKSLEREWHGFVWMNPPFGTRWGIRDWLEKFVQHGDGVAMTPSNSYTKWYQYIAERTDAMLFVRGYVQFLSPNGPVKTRASFGSALFAIGERGVDALRLATQNGLGTIIVSRS